MRDKGSSKGRSRKEVSPDETPGSGPEGKDSQAKPAQMTSKEKIAVNQKKKRRK